MYRFVLSAFVLCLTLLSAGAALAQDDDNVAVIDQIGQDNSGLINQTGRLNIAGSDADPMLQEGEFNELEINQTGLGNQIGLLGTGLNQFGDSSTPSIFNEILINQNSDRNIVGSVLQSALGAMPNGANRLFVQQGDGGLGNDNEISVIIQEQLDGMPGQLADIDQLGNNNIIELIDQRSETTDRFEENRIFAEFTGDFNGGVSLTGPALTSRALDNALVQSVGYDGLGANGNFMDLTVSGDGNAFGVFQGGRRNTVGFVTIQGDSNQLGLRQDGLENEITVTTIEGDANRIGIGQIGTNRAYVTVIGLSNTNDLLGLQEGTNDVFFTVDGDLNVLSSDQGYASGLGGDNDARFTVTGDANFFDLLQQGSNSASFDVVGSFNNNATVNQFTGDAAVDPTLAPGFFSQVGMDNFVSVSIAGSQNLIAAMQSGDTNSITAIVSGDFNQAAFIQSGSFNEAWLKQSGNSNTAGIVQ